MPHTIASLNGKSFADLLEMIEDPRRDKIIAIYKDHEDLFHTNPGSSHNHQAWEGGLADHLADMLRLSWMEFNLLSGMALHRGEKIPFTLGQAQVVIFCHDAEKVIVYGDRKDPRVAPFVSHTKSPSDKTTKEDIKQDVLDDWSVKYDLKLSPVENNAIKYTHGEGEDYRNDQRIMSELAAFVGNVDRTSARIFHSSGRDLG